MLLPVCAPEYPEAEGVQQHNADGGERTQRRPGCVHQPPAHKAVEKRHNHVVAPHQHPSEPLADDVPGVDHAAFELEVVEKVDPSQDLVQGHRQGEMAVGFVLHYGKRRVEQGQSDQGRTVAEHLQVHPEEGGIEFRAEKIAPPCPRRFSLPAGASQIQPPRKRKCEAVRDHEEGEKVAVQGRQGEGAGDLGHARRKHGEKQQRQTVEPVGDRSPAEVRPFDPAARDQHRSRKKGSHKRGKHHRRLQQRGAGKRQYGQRQLRHRNRPVRADGRQESAAPRD